MSDGKKLSLGDFEVDMAFSGNTRKNIAKLLSRAADQSAHRSNLEILAARAEQCTGTGARPAGGFGRWSSEIPLRMRGEHSSLVCGRLKKTTVISLVPNMHSAKATAE